jgi:hypothetical protein
MIHTPVWNPGNGERESVHKTREIFPRHEAWDIVVFREGVRASYPGVWIFRKNLRV